MRMPRNIGPIHFVGIGGIGMSGIAETLHEVGYEVKGSDLGEGPNVQRLREKGIEISVGHRAENIGEAEIVVASSAIPKDNPERLEAISRRLPVVRRAEMLAELMRFGSAVAIGGTHGKTTTTSLTGALLEAGGMDPTVINGGVVNAYGSNARIGGGEWIVAEADESDGSFLKLPADVAVVTNIDPEHLDHYGDFERIREAFAGFVENVPFYGFGVLCLDHPEAQSLARRVTDRRIITYGANPQADIRFFDVKPQGLSSLFSVSLRDRRSGAIQEARDLLLPMPGEHNVSNAAAAIAVAWELGVTMEQIRIGLESFKGVRRRFSFVGEWNGIGIFDDYAHHPVEIKAVLSAARASNPERVIAVKQPHRFSRLRDLFDEFCGAFNEADMVYLCPVYSAGESPVKGADSKALASGLRSSGHRNVSLVSDSDEVAERLASEAKEGDLILFLGAGDITQWASEMPGKLDRLGAGRKPK